MSTAPEEIVRLPGQFDEHRHAKAFLEEIESWRDALAKNLSLRNADLSDRQLNFAVQRIIDRVVFLRMCEGRGIEHFGQLQALANGANVYRRLVELFHRADEKYNSGLFQFQHEKGREAPDVLTTRLAVDDRTLKEILARLYYPESPYEFAALPADILGQVYEQLLGKVIRLTAGHRAKIEEKPEVRKAGGVYYTATYIVQYIVQNTVGKLVEGKTPQEIAGLTETFKPSKTGRPVAVLDPACGSGSFLIVAYQFLLDWYLKQYTEHDDPEKHARGANRRVYQYGAGDWRLTTSARKRILLSHIYGVDIDYQAVEVTKLSLLLKVLEGETEATLERQQRLFHKERALPDLADNIKCGNSLVGPDFYQDCQLSLLDEQERLRINVFDWQAEFPHIFPSPSGRNNLPSRSGPDNLSSPSGRGAGGEGNGGFDAVIGNPPYRRELDYKQLMDEIAVTAFGRRYRAPRMDLWYYFVHRGLELLKPSGVLSFIVNSYWTSGTGAEKLIDSLRDDAHIDEIFFLNKLKVFKKVAGQHMILRIANSPTGGPTTVKLARPGEQMEAAPFVSGNAPVKVFQKSPEQLFRNHKVDLQPPADDLLKKIEQWPSLDQFGIVRQGIAENPASINRKTNEKHGHHWQVGQGVFTLRAEEVENLNLSGRERTLLRPYHDLRDLGRYVIAEVPSLRLIYSTKVTCPEIHAFPKICEHLRRFRPIMDVRRETCKGCNSWWHLHWPRDENLWRSPKVIALQMGDRPAFVPAMNPVYVSFSANVFVPAEITKEHLYYIAGLLNSRVLWKWYQHHAKRRGANLEVNGNVLKRTPFRIINFSDRDAKSQHDRMVELVAQMLDLNRRLGKMKTARERTAVQRQIDATDRQIDGLVYELYGLSDDEIRLVEEATNR